MRALRFALLTLMLAPAWLAPHPAGATPAWRPVLEGPGFAPGGGELSVTLTARAERSDVGSSLLGLVAVAVPLERLAAPRKLAEAPDQTPKNDPAGAAPREPSPGAREPAPNDAEEPSDEPALPAATLARLAHAAVAAALVAHDVGLRRSELEGLGSRARTSAALPELRFRVVASNDQSLRLAPTVEDPERYTLDGGNDLVLEASATWRLNRLVFADEEIAVERLVLERERNTEKLSARVLERLFDWHRAFSRLAGADPKLRGRLELERLEAEVELDLLTGGWFGSAVRNYRVPPAKRAAYGRLDSTSSSRTSSSSTSTLPTPSQ